MAMKLIGARVRETVAWMLAKIAAIATVLALDFNYHTRQLSHNVRFLIRCPPYSPSTENL
jgi:hypothetical protein